jgi:hypothetical protein
MPKAKDPNYRQPNRAQVRDRERRAWEMRLKCKPLKDIAAELGVSIPGAFKILERVERRNKARFEKKQDRIRSRQFGQQELLIGAAFNALDKSLEPRTQVTEKVGDDGQKQTVTQVIEGAADIKYGYFILKVQSEQRDLCGLSIAPAENPGMTFVDLVRNMHERAEEYERKQSQQQPETPCQDPTDPSPPTSE